MAAIGRRGASPLSLPENAQGLQAGGAFSEMFSMRNFGGSGSLATLPWPAVRAMEPLAWHVPLWAGWRKPRSSQQSEFNSNDRSLQSMPRGYGRRRLRIFA